MAVAAASLSGFVQLFFFLTEIKVNKKKQLNQSDSLRIRSTAYVDLIAASWHLPRAMQVVFRVRDGLIHRSAEDNQFKLSSHIEAVCNEW